VVRNFTLTLWNVYSFFVTYGRLDKWTPEQKMAVEGTSQSELDRWLRSELHSLVRDITKALDEYDVPGATRPIQAFVEVLSKWYLRRSRRRFWKSESDADKQAAYTTLYEALTTLSKLLAPTMPFLAEELHQNLVRTINKDAPQSVHLSDWPEWDPAAVDEELNREMRAVIRMASVGHAARSQAGIKVRQPLAEAAFSVSSPAEQRALERHAELLEDELNVKSIRPLGSAGEVVSYSLNPLPKQLGQKYRGQYPSVRQAVLNLNTEEAARTLLDGRSIQVELNGEVLEIHPDEVEVRTEAREGLVVASEGVVLCALQTELTPALVREGLARELVRRVQEFRKLANLDIADRIHLYLEPSYNLRKAAEAHMEYIQNETLTIKMEFSEPPENTLTTTAEFDGESVKIGIGKVR
jgi:isoleucyl-tRNA synthetase